MEEEPTKNCRNYPSPVFSPAMMRLWFEISNEQVKAPNPNLKPTWFKEELENVTAEPILATLQMQSTDVFAITAQS